MAAGVRAIGPMPPDLGQVEHLAHDAKGAVCIGRLVGHLLHHRRHIGPLHILDLHPPQNWNDVAVNHALVAELRAGLVALLGVVLHELGAQFLDRGCLARLRLVATGIAAPANLGQPVLGQRAGLFDGQFPVQAQSGLAPLAGIRAVLEHEHLATCWCNLAQEAGHQRIAQFDGLRLGLCRIDCGLGDLDLGHDDS